MSVRSLMSLTYLKPKTLRNKWLRRKEHFITYRIKNIKLQIKGNHLNSHWSRCLVFKGLGKLIFGISIKIHQRPVIENL